MRHALGQLYQETHLVVESEGRQLAIPGFDPAPEGELRQRDVRFTPRSLARSLVEAALRSMAVPNGLPPRLTILDPACGSGVFLIESIGALLALGFSGHVTLRGLDISRLSVDMARFALGHAARDAQGQGLRVDFVVEEVDSLTVVWDEADIVVTNPPFVPWVAMTASDQDLVKGVLGPSSRGRVDKAMAFLAKAGDSRRGATVVASVLPAALLETELSTTAQY